MNTLSDTLRTTAQQVATAALCGVSAGPQDLHDLAEMLDTAASRVAELERARQMVPAILPENVIPFRLRDLRGAMRRLDVSHA